MTRSATALRSIRAATRDWHDSRARVSALLSTTARRAPIGAPLNIPRANRSGGAGVRPSASPRRNRRRDREARGGGRSRGPRGLSRQSRPMNADDNVGAVRNDGLPGGRALIGRPREPSASTRTTSETSRRLLCAMDRCRRSSAPTPRSPKPGRGRRLPEEARKRAPKRCHRRRRRGEDRRSRGRWDGRPRREGPASASSSSPRRDSLPAREPR